ncbi:hypothetical protein AB0M79_01300 [Polymorphospora sp. NPDC051019]|uniref:hypothetical protein n=1 Tax=Polymorphospora sp. NPDC051019 TaxID=3155725 RepID=UPI003444D9DA
MAEVGIGHLPADAGAVVADLDRPGTAEFVEHHVDRDPAGIGVDGVPQQLVQATHRPFDEPLKMVLFDFHDQPGHPDSFGAESRLSTGSDTLLWASISGPAGR